MWNIIYAINIFCKNTQNTKLKYKKEQDNYN